MRRPWWLALTMWVVPALAGAQDRSAVVAVGQCAIPGTAITARSFRSAATQRFAAVETEAETAAPFGGLAERTLPELNGALGSARSDFYSDKPDSALATLKKALEDVTRLPPTDERWGTERDMLTFLAQVQLKTDRATAEATLFRVFRVDPDYKPDVSIYPPSFQRFVGEVRKASKKRPTSRLDVTVSPPGKKVFVGGKRVGVAPVSVRVPAGDYRVEADWGYRGLARTVNVAGPPQPTQPLELSQAVEGAVAPDGGPCVEPGADAAVTLAGLMPTLGASRVFGVRTDTKGIDRYAAVIEVSKGGTAIREVRVKLQPGAPEGEALGSMAGYFSTGTPGPTVEVLRGPGARPTGVAAAPAPLPPVTAAAPAAAAAPRPAAEVTQPRGDPGAGLRTAGWIFTGVGIAGVVVGGIEFLGANSKKSDLDSAKVNGAFPAGYQSTYQSTNDSIKSQQTVAVIAGGVGVAALATGVVMLFVAGGQSAGAHASVSPALIPGGGGAVLAGSF